VSRNISFITQEMLGPGHILEDSNPVPIAYRTPEAESPLSSGTTEVVKPPIDIEDDPLFE
jgi:hypothetical protein